VPVAYESADGCVTWACHFSKFSGAPWSIYGDRTVASVCYINRRPRLNVNRLLISDELIVLQVAAVAWRIQEVNELSSVRKPTYTFSVSVANSRNKSVFLRPPDRPDLRMS